jgi:hypothetical protein
VTAVSPQSPVVWYCKNYHVHYQQKSSIKLNHFSFVILAIPFPPFQETNAKVIQELLRDFNREFKWTTVQKTRLPPLIIGLCKDMLEIFKDEARCLKLSSPTYILGDLHGNYKDLIGFEQLFWRATPFLTPASFLFLGDYVDRGKHGLEVRGRFVL